MMKIKEFISEQIHHLKLILVKERYNSKVFCVGFNKTGTTTIGKSLEELGYRNTSFNKKVWRKWYRQGKIDKVIQYTAKFDSTDDLPWLKEDMIPILDNAFPNSKFIYLERDEEAWKKSLRKWRKKNFGDDVNVELAWEEYGKHKEFISSYFKDFEPNRFLSLRVNDPEGFKKLALFLDRKTDQLSFKIHNKS